MNIYIDESGSINNHNPNGKYFVITLVCVSDVKSVKRSYKRFVSANMPKLRSLDKKSSRMFVSGKFRELKGSAFNKKLKSDFAAFFAEKHNLDVFYIVFDNSKLSDVFCSNTARAFNYALRLAIESFVKRGLIPNERHLLQIDERNERTRSRFFLEDYLNTELAITDICPEGFSVIYYDSADNQLIQLADVFSNLCYSHLVTGKFGKEFDLLAKAGVVHPIFSFPIQQKK